MTEEKNGNVAIGGDFFAGFKIKPKALRWMTPDQTTPHPLNWKIHPEAQLAEIEKGLEEFGWVPSMLALYNERTGHVIDAHGRREASAKMKKRMPVVVIDVDEKTENRILASMDKIGEMRDTDQAALRDLLEKLEADGGMPPGYEPDALGQLVKALEIPNELPPRLDQGFGADEVETKEIYQPGSEVTCPHCDKTFVLE